MRAPIGMFFATQGPRDILCRPNAHDAAHDGRYRIGKSDPLQDLRSHNRVHFHLFEFFRENFPGLLMICSGTASFPMSCNNAAARSASI